MYEYPYIFRNFGFTQPRAILNILDFAPQSGIVSDWGVIANDAIMLGESEYPNGFRLVFPANQPYTINTPIVSNIDNFGLIGDGWGSQLIAGPGLPAGPMFQVLAPGGNGVFRYGIRIAHIFLNGNNIAGINGLELDSTYQALIDHVRIRYCKGISVNLSGNSGARGAYTHLIGCHITDGSAGIGIQTQYHENVVMLGGILAHFQSTGGIGFKSQDGVNQVIGTVFDNCDTGMWVYFASANRLISCEFTNGLTNFVNLNGATDTIIDSCYFNSFLGTGSKNMIAVDNANNIVHNCVAASGTGWTNFIHESGGSCLGNIYESNNIGSLPIVLATGSTGVVRNNQGYNPRGNIAAPVIPASGTAQTNSFGSDAMVFITGGTVTAIAIGGTNTGLTTGAFRVPANQTITITYSVAPTWSWFLD